MTAKDWEKKAEQLEKLHASSQLEILALRDHLARAHAEIARLRKLQSALIENFAQHLHEELVEEREKAYLRAVG